MSAYFSSPSTFLGFLDSISNGLKAHLPAPTATESSSSMITSPRNGFALPSSRFSVSPHVGFLRFYQQIPADLCHLIKVVHIVQAIRFRLWWLFPTAIFCGILETTGWSARLWMSRNPFLATLVIIQ